MDPAKKEVRLQMIRALAKRFKPRNVTGRNVTRIVEYNFPEIRREETEVDLALEECEDSYRVSSPNSFGPSYEEMRIIARNGSIRTSVVC